VAVVLRAYSIDLLAVGVLVERDFEEGKSIVKCKKRGCIKRLVIGFFMK
jgi:hypothetical protein